MGGWPDFKGVCVFGVVRLAHNDVAVFAGDDDITEDGRIVLGDLPTWARGTNRSRDDRSAVVDDNDGQGDHSADQNG